MDGPSAPPVADASSTAEAIADRAAELFAEKGFAATSIREIAEAAGVTKPTLYYYFGSKEGLVRHIVRGSICAFADAVARCVAADASLEETLLAIAESQLTYADAHPAAVKLFCRIQHQPPGEVPLDDLCAESQEGLSRLAALFEAAAERGEIAARDSFLLATSFAGSLFSHIVGRWREERLAAVPAADLARQIVDLFLVGAIRREP